MLVNFATWCIWWLVLLVLWIFCALRLALRAMTLIILNAIFVIVSFYHLSCGYKIKTLPEMTDNMHSNLRGMSTNVYVRESADSYLHEVVNCIYNIGWALDDSIMQPMRMLQTISLMAAAIVAVQAISVKSIMTTGAWPSDLGEIIDKYRN